MRQVTSWAGYLSNAEGAYVWDARLAVRPAQENKG
jgi:hypothetical protein